MGWDVVMSDGWRVGEPPSVRSGGRVGGPPSFVIDVIDGGLCKSQYNMTNVLLHRQKQNIAKFY